MYFLSRVVIFVGELGVFVSGYAKYNDITMVFGSVSYFLDFLLHECFKNLSFVAG